jgi:hypothetical protein
MPGWQARPKMELAGGVNHPALTSSLSEPHDFGGLADIHFPESEAHGRCNRNKPGVQLAAARVTFGRLM